MSEEQGKTLERFGMSRETHRAVILLWPTIHSLGEFIGWCRDPRQVLTANPVEVVNIDSEQYHHPLVIDTWQDEEVNRWGALITSDQHIHPELRPYPVCLTAPGGLEDPDFGGLPQTALEIIPEVRQLLHRIETEQPCGRGVYAFPVAGMPPQKKALRLFPWSIGSKVPGWPYYDHQELLVAVREGLEIGKLWDGFLAWYVRNVHKASMLQTGRHMAEAVEIYADEAINAVCIRD